MRKKGGEDVEMTEDDKMENKVVKAFEKVSGAQLTIEDKITIKQELQGERKRKRYSGDEGSKETMEAMGPEGKTIRVPKLKVKIIQKMICGLMGSKYAHNILKDGSRPVGKEKETQVESRKAPANAPEGPKGNGAMKRKTPKREERGEGAGKGNEKKDSEGEMEY
jgi:hypothetical protein